MQKPGAFAWSELIADDVQGAAAFYGDVFGWTFDRVVAPRPFAAP
jgi:predicted enzyme related to lactoylglutathione lyase